MPIYEYQCQDCGAETEVLQKISDAALVDCQACGKPALKKKVSAAAFRLKGSGWYETDFKTSNKRNIAGGEKSGGEKSGGEKTSGDTAGGDKSSGTKGKNKQTA